MADAIENASGPVPAASTHGDTGPSNTRKPGFKDYIRIFSHATSWDYLLLGCGTFASIAAGVTMPLMNVVFGDLVHGFNNFAAGTATVDDLSAQIDKQSLYMFALFIARFGLNYINKLCFRIIGIRMSAALRLQYMTALLAQTVHVLDSMPSGAAASVITSRANTLQMGISETLGTFIEYSATMVAALIIAFARSWFLTLVTCSVILFITLVSSVTVPLIIAGESKMATAETGAASVATESFSAVRMITSCGAERRMVDKYDVWVKQGRAAGAGGGPPKALQFGLVFFSIFGAFALSFWYGAKSYVEGRIDSVGTVTVVFMSVILLIMSVERIASPVFSAARAMVAASEFFAVIDAPKPKTGTLKMPHVSASEDIVFTNVYFAYPSRPSKKVLDGLNLRIEANKNTAIVGPSGSGKSTIVGLIEGWYTLYDQYAIARVAGTDKAEGQKNKGNAAESSNLEEYDGGYPLLDLKHKESRVELKGSITTCGHSLDNLDIKWWRSQIGLVQQEPFLFNDTIYNNVACGLIGTEWENESEDKKRELVKTACQESFADEFIDRLPDGYNTLTGESGMKLSGGQRQRIAIARSIISKPRILILDEATSAIDVHGERLVQAALDRASKGRTTITIAHRLSTIKNADRICVLQGGKVVEQGTHESLLASPEGMYYGLVHAQKLSLGDEDDEESTSHGYEDTSGILEREKSEPQLGQRGTEEGAAWKQRGLFNGFGKLLYEQRSRFPYYLIALIFAAGASTTAPMQAYLFSHTIVTFTEPPQQLLADSVFWAKMWTALACGVGFSYFIVGFVLIRLEHYIAAVYRREYFDSILFQKTSYFDQKDNATGQLTARLSNDPTQLKELLGMNMGILLIGIFSMVGAMIVSFAFGWQLALVALCVTVPISLGSSYYRMYYELQFTAMNDAVFSESSKFGAESISAFRTVSSLVMEASICERYQRLLNGHVRAAYRKARFSMIVFAFADSATLACQALIFWYGGRLLLTGQYTETGFLVTYMAVIQGAEGAGQWLSFGPNAANASAAASRILEVRETRAQDTSLVDEHIPDTDNGVKIDLEGVCFKYPTRDVSIFKGLNLTIEKGHFAAIVGASGSGKTSIISLLERFYEVDEGRILFNGKDIAKINVYEYRKLLSLVAQDPTLFQGTIRENILLGVDPSSITDEQLHQACRDANIHDFIVSLPNSYETNIGSRGVDLSGGQKQRVSIARALIRNPRVLLLDEATSSLDSESERLVQAALERVARGRTTIAVAHRLATVQKADIIYVLGEGKVLEKGNHGELLRKKGVYWHMCHSQALDR